MPGTKSTESSILDSIPDIMGDENDATESPSNTGTETSTESNTEGGSPATTTTTTDNADGKGGTSNPQAAGTTEPAAQPITRRDGLIEVPSKTNPNTRDLVDPATGQVIAAGGRERSHFERAQKMHHEARVAQAARAQFEQRAAIAEAKLGQQNEVMQLAQQAGIDHNAHKIAVDLMGRFLKDPVSVLTDMVAEVKAKGYNIPFLESGVTPGMDALAVQRMLDQRLAPITQQREQLVQQQRIEQEAKQSLDNFLAEEPDAVHNIGIIGEMLTREPALGGNLHKAWAKLLRLSYEAGLNPAQPLGPQYQAKMQQQTQQQPTTVVGNPQPPRPLPNGRQVANPVPVQEARQFDENSRMSDIIKHAMRESGMTA